MYAKEKTAMKKLIAAFLALCLACSVLGLVCCVALRKLNNKTAAAV